MMMLLKKYDRKIYKTRYQKYKIFFFVSAGIFAVFFLLNLLFGFENVPEIISVASFLDLFFGILTYELLFYLTAFIFGITLYSPFLQIVESALKGFLSGWVFFSVWKMDISAWIKILVTVYEFISAFILITYLSFCTLVSLRLYSDGITYSVNKEENRMFGGTLFNSTLFCNTVNLRFLFSYCLIFVFSLILQSGLSLIYSYIASLLINT